MKTALVVSGSRGLGLAIVDALRGEGFQVHVVPHTESPHVLAKLRPDVLVVNAGAPPVTGTVAELTWEQFSTNWNADVRVAFEWTQAALRLPLHEGARVLLMSSGAAVRGSPRSGGYAGAKRMVWLLAEYANKLGSGIHFQALLPLALVQGTHVGEIGARAYAGDKSLEQFWAGYTPRLTAADVGGAAVEVLRSPGVAFGVKDGIHCLDA